MCSCQNKFSCGSLSKAQCRHRTCLSFRAPRTFWQFPSTVLFEYTVVTRESSDWTCSRAYTDLLVSNFHGKKLCTQAVMYIFEWRFHTEWVLQTVTHNFDYTGSQYWVLMVTLRHSNCGDSCTIAPCRRWQFWATFPNEKCRNFCGVILLPLAYLNLGVAPPKPPHVTCGAHFSVD